ncbi:hypothetical protein CKO41_13015 [Thiococcus pfennigii]|nr:hypothetical protein [Thiococcus pfennigii]MBK1732687.1 hypothetical protein [Thiococcus pfennigii]
MPLERGQVFTFQRTDDDGLNERFHYVAAREFVEPCNGKTYRLGFVGNGQGIEPFPLRSTTTKLYALQSDSCTERLLWQDARVGTSWSYDDEDGQPIYVTIEAVDETVTVPAGTFHGAIKFRLTKPAWGSDWAEWIQPGFFMLKMEDYSEPPYVVEELAEFRRLGRGADSFEAFLETK